MRAAELCPGGLCSSSAVSVIDSQGRTHLFSDDKPLWTALFIRRYHVKWGLVGPYEEFLFISPQLGVMKVTTTSLQYIMFVQSLDDCVE